MNSFWTEAVTVIELNVPENARNEVCPEILEE
jgi:hypothetical protein